MTYKQFRGHLDKQDPAPVYLFLGGADLLVDEAWKTLLDKTVPPGARRFSGERLSAEEHEAEDVLNRLRILPMFASRRLVMVQKVESWKKEQRQALLAYLEQPSPKGCLVLTAASRKGLEKLEEAVKRHGQVVTFPVVSGKEIQRWLQERAAGYGKKMSLPAAHHLVERVGEDLGSLESELNKLSLYVGDRSRIEVQDVEETVSAQRSLNVFEMVRCVGSKEPGKALHALRQLILAGEVPLVILALLARQIRIMWQVKEGMERRLSTAQMAREMGIPPYAVGGYAKQAEAFTEDDLHAAHGAMRRADVRMKSTGTSPALILEEVIVGLCLDKTSP